MDFMTKKVKDEVETMAKRQEQSKVDIPPEYHHFLIYIRQNKQIGNLRQGEKLSPEARNLGAWDKDGKVYVSLDTPYFTVDGRVAWARREHRKEGKLLRIEAHFEPTTKLFCATVESEIYGKAMGHAIANIGGGGVDRTNPMENAESSAIGRALGFLGYGLIGTGIASAEEVMAAMNEGSRSAEQAPSKPTPSPEANGSRSNAPSSTPQAEVRNINDHKNNASSNHQHPTHQKQQPIPTTAGAATYSGDVRILGVKFEEAPSGSGLMATIDVVDQDGSQRTFIAGSPLADRLDELNLQPGTLVWLVAKEIPARGYWLALDLKVAEQQTA